MAHRAKHRKAAMLRRVEQGRMIKPDHDNPEYKAAKRSLASRKSAATKRANKARAQDPAVLEKAFGKGKK